ncbi:hypothetical protein [Paenibacillus sp. PL91]|uniref:hypothetical protein n=1 Tax=Paenibacillus sp. PL91 TaxID=2729538 RepID=UPI0016593B80|nr:hypothetical protein [Paenibacillus sp. PL91]MBC9204958.1 hypothetical protein [Paenibacillus sp. PL91]
MEQLDFLDTPWETVTEDMANSFQKELINELGEAHILYKKSATALAHRIDNDDVIFWINELEKYAIVHLTWSKYNSSGYPRTEFFSLEVLRVHCKTASDFY